MGDIDLALKVLNIDDTLGEYTTDLSRFEDLPPPERVSHKRDKIGLATRTIYGVDLEPQEPESRRGAFNRGLRSGAAALGSIGGGLASWTGDVINDTDLQQWGADVAAAYQQDMQELGHDVPTAESIFWNTDEFDSFSAWLDGLASWAGYNVASGAVTSLPSLVAGMVAGAASPAVGVVVGGAVLYGMGVGEHTATQLEDQEDPNAAIAAAVGVPYALAERWLGAGSRLARALTGKQKAAVARTLARRIAREVPASMLSEAGAETIQTILTEGVSRLELGESVGSVVTDPNFGRALFEAAAAGAVAGGPFGAVGALQKPPGQPPVEPTAEQPTEPPIAGGPVEPPPVEPEPVGGREQAAAQEPELTPEDEASPIDNDLIREGKKIVQDIQVTGELDGKLSAMGFPGIGTGLTVTADTINGGEPVHGRVHDLIEGEDGVTVIVEDDDGFQHYVNTLDETISIQIDPTPEEKAAAADFDRFRQELAEVTQDQANAELLVNTELEREGFASIEELPADRRSKLLGAVRKAASEQQKVVDEAEKQGEQQQQEIEKQEEDAVKQAEKDAQDIEKAEQEAQAEADAQLVFRENEAAITEEAKGEEEGQGLTDDEIADIRKGVLDKMEVAEGEDIATLSDRRDTFSKLFQGELKKRRKEVEAEAKAEEERVLFQGEVDDLVVDVEGGKGIVDEALKEQGFEKLDDVPKAKRRSVKAAVKRGVQAKEREAKAKEKEAERKAKKEADEVKKAEEQAKKKAEQEKAKAEAAESESVGGQRPKAEKETEGETNPWHDALDDLLESGEITLGDQPKGETTGGSRPRTGGATRQAPAAETETTDEPKPFGSTNKLVRIEDAEKDAERLKELLRQKTTTFHSGMPIDPEMAKLLLRQTAFYVEGGIRTFAEYSEAMVKKFGETVRPYLADAWNNFLTWKPGVDAGLTEGLEATEVTEAETETETDEEQETETEEEVETEEETTEETEAEGETETEDQGTTGGKGTKKRKKKRKKHEHVGQHIWGRRSRLQGQLTENVPSEKEELAKKINKLTGRGAAWKIDLPDNATSGTTVYLQSVRDRIMSFTAFMRSKYNIHITTTQDGKPKNDAKSIARMLGQKINHRGIYGTEENLEAGAFGGREDGELVQDFVMDDVAEYLAIIEAMRDATADVTTVTQAADALRKLMYGSDDQAFIDESFEINTDLDEGPMIYNADIYNNFFYMMTVRKPGWWRLPAEEQINTERKDAYEKNRDNWLTDTGKMAMGYLYEGWEAKKAFGYDEDISDPVTIQDDDQPMVRARSMNRKHKSWQDTDWRDDTLEDWRAEFKTKDNPEGDVDGKIVSKKFNIRRIDYGKEGYASDKHRQWFLNQFYDAFMDLSQVLGVDPDRLGWLSDNEIMQVSVAYAREGQGGRFSAFFDPYADPTGWYMAFVRDSSDGSFAHEWAHFFDYAITEPQGVTNRRMWSDLDLGDAFSSFKNSFRWTISEDKMMARIKRLLKGELRDHDETRSNLQLAKDFISELGESNFHIEDKYVEERDYLKSSRALESGGKHYWSNMTEMFARATESYVYDTLGGKSLYLVGPEVAESSWSPERGYRGTPYPRGQDRRDLNEAFEDFFGHIDWTEQGPRLKDGYKPPLVKELDEAKENLGAIDLEQLQKDLVQGQPSAGGLWWYSEKDGYSWKRDKAPPGWTAFVDRHADYVGYPKPLEVSTIEEAGLEWLEVDDQSEDYDVIYLEVEDDSENEELVAVGGGRARPLEETPPDDGERPPGAGGLPGRAPGERGESEGSLDPTAEDRDGSDDSAGNVDEGVPVPPDGEGIEDTGTGEESASVTLRDYEIGTLDQLETGTTEEQISANVDAVVVVEGLARQGALANEEGQRILAQYSGWRGDRGDLFDKDLSEYKDKRATLHRVFLGDSKRYDDLDDSQHGDSRYVPKELAFTMWKAMSDMGFTEKIGGNLLDPNMGIGNFFGTMPKNLRPAVRMTGIEADVMSAKVGKQLYQNATVSNTNFHTNDEELATGFFDAAVGFLPVNDRKFREAVYDPDGQKSASEYYIWKTLNLTRPGGLVAVAAPTSFMDNESTYLRGEVGTLADLVFAVRVKSKRLNEGYAGSDEATDLLFFRRKMDGQNLADKTELKAWKQVKQVAEPSYSWRDPVMANEYFADNPDHVIGDFHDSDGGMVWSGTDEEMHERLETILRAIPRDIALPRVLGESLAGAKDENADGIDNGTIHFVGDTLNIRRRGEDYEIAADGNEDTIRGLIGIRESLQSLLDLQRDAADDAAITDARKALNDTYDAFVKEHKSIADALGSTVFGEDLSMPLLAGLEIWVENDKRLRKPKKAKVFTENIIAPAKLPDEAENAEEALGISLSQYGFVNLDAMGELLGGLDKASIIADLKGRIFNDPRSTWVTAETYLTGDVKEKLKQARAAAKQDPAFKENVAALKAVIPEDITLDDITLRPGMPFVPAGMIKNFVSETSNLWHMYTFGAAFDGRSGKWSVTSVADKKSEQAEINQGTAETIYGMGSRGAHFMDMVHFMLNGGSPAIYTKGGDGRRRLNPEQTTVARARLDALRKRFHEWVNESTERKDELTRLVNANMNNIVSPKFDGSHLHFPGMATGIEMRPHQKDAVWRMMQQKSLYLAHEVGTGKTNIMVAAAMEAKRMNRARKPMMVVELATLRQIEQDARELYPGARILTLELASERKPEEREAQLKEMAEKDWDLIIVPNTSLDKLPVSPTVQREFIEEKMDEVGDRITYNANAGNKHALRELNRIQREYQKRLRKLDEKAHQTSQTGHLSFEATGVDMLMVDEAHKYKNLYFDTAFQRKGTRIIGLAATPSERSDNMHLISRSLHKKGHRLYMASGTPISNSITEYFAVARYIAETYLARRGLNIVGFDNWINFFGEIHEEMEHSSAGDGFNPVVRIKFNNLDILQQIYNMFVDRVSATGAGVKRPPQRGGGLDTVVIEPSKEQEEYNELIEQRSEMIRNSPMQAMYNGVRDNFLRLIDNWRKASMDMRMVDPDAKYNPNGKIGTVVKNAKDIYDQTSKFKGTQIIFVNMFASKANPNFNVNEEITLRLVESGVPKEEIANIHKISKKDRQAMFAKMRKGDIRFLIASGSKGGTGVNVQDLVAAIHLMDTSWTPAHIEQSIGRGYRFGNRVFDDYGWELVVRAYTMNGMIDSFLWGKIQQKLEIIKGVFLEKVTVKEADDLDEEADLNAGYVAAISKRNPDLLNFVNLTKTVATLEAERQGHKKSVKDANEGYKDTFVKVRQIEDDVKTVEGWMGAIEGLSEVSILDPESNKMETVPWSDNADVKRAAQKLWSSVVKDGPDKRDTTWMRIGDIKVVYFDQHPETDKRMFKVVMPKSNKLTFDGQDGDKIYINTYRGDGHINKVGFRAVAESNTIAQILERLTKEMEKHNAEAEKDMEGLVAERDKFLELTQAEWAGEENYQEQIVELKRLRDKVGEAAAQIETQIAGRVQGLDEESDVGAATRREEDEEVSHSRFDGGRRQEKLEDVSEADIADEMSDIGKRIFGDSFNVEVEDDLTDASGATVYGKYAKWKAMAILKRRARGPMLRTLYHEGIHHLRASNAFTKGEWATLRAEARRSWIDRFAVRERYPDASEDVIVEEAVAEAFADYMAGSPPRSFIQKIFAKVRRFLDAVLNWRGLADARDIFDGVAQGAYAEAIAASGGTGAQFSRPVNAPGNPEFDEWFRGSEVVEEETRQPMIVYHGTASPQKFARFDPERRGKGSEGADVGYFFTTNEDYAWDMAIGGNIVRKMKGGDESIDTGRVSGAYLSIKRPKHFYAGERDPQTWWDTHRDPKEEGHDTAINEEISDLLAVWKDGYDGIVVNSDYDGRMFIAFEPEQIRSAEPDGMFQRRLIHRSPIEFEASKIRPGVDGMIHLSETDIVSLKMSMIHRYDFESTIDTDQMPEVDDLGEWKPDTFAQELEERGILPKGYADDLIENYYLERHEGEEEINRDEAIEIGDDLMDAAKEKIGSDPALAKRLGFKEDDDLDVWAGKYDDGGSVDDLVSKLVGDGILTHAEVSDNGYVMSSLAGGGQGGSLRWTADETEAMQEIFLELSQRGISAVKYVNQAETSTQGDGSEGYSVAVINPEILQPAAEQLELFQRPEKDFEFESEATEEKWTEAAKGIQDPLGNRIRSWFGNFFQSWVRTHKYLPRSPQFADAHAILRRVQAAPSVATEEVVRQIHGMIEGLSKQDRDLMTRRIVMDDFIHDVKRGLKIPFFSDHDEFKAEYQRLAKVMNKRPDLMQRIAARQRYVNKVKRLMVQHGVMTEQQATNTAYYRHQVIAYFNSEFKQGKSGRLRKAHVFQRKGTDLLINADLVQAESEWLFKALVKVTAHKALDALDTRYSESANVRRDMRVNNARGIENYVVQAIKRMHPTVEVNSVNQWRGYLDQFKEDSTSRKAMPQSPDEFEDYMGFRQQIAIGFMEIGLDEKLDEVADDIPEAFQPAYRKFRAQGEVEMELRELKKQGAFDSAADMDRARGELLADRLLDEDYDAEPFGLLKWILDNYQGKAAGGAAIVMKTISARRQYYKDALGDDFYMPHEFERGVKNFRPGMALWQPDAGNLIFSAHTMPERHLIALEERLQDMVQDATDMFSKEELAEVIGHMTEARIMGPKKRQWVVPQELSDTLDTFTDTGATSEIDRFWRGTQRSWKAWALINPRNWLGYNLKNLSGDLDHVIAGFPSAIMQPKHFTSAMKELWDVQVLRKKPSDLYLEAAENGVFDAGWAIAEVYEAKSDINDLLGTRTAGDIPMTAFRKVWRLLSRSTTVRENIMRFAVYRAAKEKIDKVEAAHPDWSTPDVMAEVGYGAANWRIVDATGDSAARAGWIARETLGDYGNISVAGEWLRHHMIPFWSWQEINLKFYGRMTMNIIHTSKGFTRGKKLSTLGVRFGYRFGAMMAVRTVMLTAMLWAWNNYLFPEEEEELSEEDRLRMHLILGRNADGTVNFMRLPGALSDALAWFGFEDVMMAVSNIEKGRGDLTDVVDGIVNAPINRVLNSVTPFIKSPFETFTGRSLYPDYRQRRAIKDPWRHLTRSLAMENEYDAMLGRPTRGYWESWLNRTVVRRDPGEMAYNFVRGLGYDFIKDELGRDFSGEAYDEESRTLYYWRMARRYEDKDAEARYEAKLNELGVRGQRRQSAIKRLHPLGAIPRKHRNKFLKSLAPDERSRLERAVGWYNRIF